MVYTWIVHLFLRVGQLFGLDKSKARTPTVSCQHLTSQISMPSSRFFAIFLGVMLLFVMVMQGLVGWFSITWLNIPSALAVMVVIPLLVLNGGFVARTFIALSLICTLVTLLLLDSPGPVIWAGIVRALFFQAFMTAIFTLQEPTLRSAALRNIGRYLLHQPIRRRSAMIMLGTNLLTIMMNIGSLVLIGSIASADQKTDGDSDPSGEPKQKQIALATARGFSPASLWSPLALPPVFVASFYPGISIPRLMGFGFIIAMAQLGLGFIVMFSEMARLKQKSPALFLREVSPARFPVKSFGVLIFIVTLIFGTIETVVSLLDINVSNAVLLVIPVAAIVWLLVQSGWNLKVFLSGPVKNIVSIRLPQQAPETSVLVAAAFMSPMILALMPYDLITHYINAETISSSAFMALLFSSIVGLGALGISPIITITVAIALTGDPANFGLTSVQISLVLLSAWSLCAQLSPYVSSTIIIARIFSVNSRVLVFNWNGTFFVASTLLGIAVILAI